jgi:hypothetical protein
MSPRISSTELAEHLAQRAAAATPGPAKPRRAPTRKEREIQRAILDFLRTVPGVVAWRNNAGLTVIPESGMHRRRVIRGSLPGISDIVGFQRWCGRLKTIRRAPGAECDACSARFLAIEVKRSGEFPTQEQAAFLKAVRDAGGLAIVARSVHDVVEALGLT